MKRLRRALARVMSVLNRLAPVKLLSSRLLSVSMALSKRLPVKLESLSSLLVFLQPDQSIPGSRLSKQSAWAGCIDITLVKATRQIGSSVVLVIILRIVTSHIMVV